MSATYHLEIQEFTPAFVEHIQSIFQSGKLTVIVKDESEEYSNDSDDYPMNNPVQHSILQRRIKEIEQDIPRIPLDINEFLNVSERTLEIVE